MRSTRRKTLMGFLFVLAIAAVGPPTARAQMGMSGAGRSLGGYGAATISGYYGGGRGSYLPYNGNASGFVPYQGGYAGGLGVQPIPRRLPRTPVGGTSMPSTPIGGASLSGGMADGGRPAFLPFGYEGGIGMPGGLMGAPLTGQSMARRPPSGPGLGYPFRMPPLLSGSGTGSMAMP